jgi:hypothetical protein
VAHVLIDNLQFWVATNAKRIGAALGGQIGGLLGCGSAGCAYAFGKRDQVVKFTLDGSHEAPTWQAYMDLQRTGEDLPSLPRVDLVTEVSPGPPGSPTVWAIVREDVEPLENVDADLAEQVVHDLKEYEFGLASDMAFHWNLYDGAVRVGDQEQQALARERLDDMLNDLGQHMDSLRLTEADQPFHDTVYRLAELGLPPEDLHGGNLGYKDGTVMLLDPISSSTKDDVRERRLIANSVRQRVLIH